jgi:hypothetical protein
MFRGSVKSTVYLLHSPVSPSLPLPCVTVCHHSWTGFYPYKRFPKGSSYVFSCTYVLLKWHVVRAFKITLSPPPPCKLCWDFRLVWPNRGIPYNFAVVCAIRRAVCFPQVYNLEVLTLQRPGSQLSVDCTFRCAWWGRIRSKGSELKDGCLYISYRSLSLNTL